MAEELDNTQKPKVELIKRQKGEGENPGGVKSAADSNGKNVPERPRKVIVVKKKAPAAPVSPVPASPAPASPSAGPAKKPQPKVVVSRSVGKNDIAPRDAVPRDEPETAAAVQGAVAKTDSAPVSDTGQQVKKPAEEGGAPPQHTGERKAVSLPATQRPALAAGKVRGRLVGPRPVREDGKGAAVFTPRPTTAAGRVAGRPVGNRPGGEGGFSSRPGDRPGVPGRPGGFGGQYGAGRSGAPGPGNRPGGFRPRPGVPGRPGSPRPGTGNLPPPGTSPIDGGKGPAKKTFKAKKSVYQHRQHEMAEKLLQTKKKISSTANPVPKSIDIMEVVSVSELAKKMNLKASDLIQKLMSMGMMVTINQQIDAETATILAAEFGADVKIVSLYEETVIESAADDAASLAPRPPVVTVMGHVDHGKTKLLDAIRSADVVAGEFGGITQHIGAYMVDTPQGSITFLDTPGHEAFTRMRARGAQVTDIVVLVVAADDGVMPQTVEAINHAKEADVPIIVAVNKMDKPEANPDRVKTQLSEHQLIPEEWGGQTMFVELSALRKEGIDKLIEAILLEAEILDLKANYNHSAEGKILEARIDHGRGIVATVLVERGTLRIGDSFVAGIWPGKVRALFNDKGEKVTEATPSMPVEVLGFEGGPNAGEPLQVVDDERVARGISSKRQELKRFEDAKNIRKITLDNLRDTINEGTIQELKVIIKSDVQGSAEALRSSLEKLSTAEVRLHVIQALPGAINEGDVDLAIASNAIIIGFNVRPVPKAKMLADQEKVDIRKYNVIYKAVEEIQQAMEGMLKPDTREEVIATVEVRNTFKVPKAGTIAGCYVLTGTVKRSARVNVIREEIVIYTGKIASLRRFKDDAREVAAGYECGMGIDGFDSIQVGDQLEVFEIVEVARKLA
ncbi:MAG: translation initiation factor IF-2 [Spirochaetaceae bacterium]|jgi:translation initiation factor IF-2|nr:translation initiation factor IF-2 [Spirochaetaceae bacterium]